MQVLRHRLIDPSGNPVAGHTAHVMEYETPEEAYYRGYRRVPIVTAVSDDNGWLTWLLPRTVSNVYVVNGIEPLPVVVTVPYGVPSVTVTEARTGVVTGGGVRLPAAVDLVTELELSAKLAGMTRDLVGELVADPSFMQELAESPDLLEALSARPELGGTADPDPNSIVKRDEFGAAALVSLQLSGPPQSPDSAVRKDYVDALGTVPGTANTVVRRDENGQSGFQFVSLGNAPVDDTHAVRKDYADALGTDFSDPDTIMRRDGNGWVQVRGLWNLQELDGDLTTKDRTVASTVGFVRDWVDLAGTATPTPGTLARRNIAGDTTFNQVKAGAAAPTDADHLARKDYVDALGGAPATPNTVVRRDAAGGADFGWLSSGDVTAWNAPTQAGHLTRKDYVDALGTDAATPSTVARRNTSGNSSFGTVFLSNAPTSASQATRKDYVDALGTNANTPDTVMRRDGGGWTQLTALSLGAAPSSADRATRKDYVDAGDTAAKDRVNHTGTQASTTITDLTEAVQDIVGAFLRAGTGTTVTYDDALGTFTINATGTTTQTDPEIVRDVIGTAMVAGAGIQITVNDVGDQITVASTAVLPTRQVISGTGLTGGGDLSADRTLAVTYGTAAGTAAQGNDSRITGAVQTSRQVISGTGLAGGGTLAADRTLSVSYGSAAGTAVQGNDARVVADQVAGTASIRTLGTGAQQAAAGNHTHAGMVTGTGITAMQALTQAAYDAIVTKSATTLYVIQG